ncbi:aryl-alcohol dehydrogenase-like predicted oxidoreductase [Leucobacter luti]|uniref:aldo/keto reductase n=1 Tax=Leucobacter luti TaxID=340320 RepID=UPI0010430D14|nr:aldo/keto reductase [Leucobacter luti]MCW2288277.1 aryl-alcohol dehydrogenase-like predicted oxidoreductase [Leucobacter luti]TCK45565.1 aryl-alcohol dehydrogenase-like predicted oxidoreductase [Leucobacter luti]
MTHPPVPRRRIGTSELETSVFALGSWHIYDRMHFEDAVQLVRTAIDRGITLFDVGVYAMPGSPPAFTDVLFSAIVRAAGVARDEYLLSEKLWLEGWDEHTGFRSQLNGALFRVGAEHADLVVLGDLRRDDVALRDIVLNLAELSADGLIRAWGVNNWSASSVQELLDIAASEGVPGPEIAQLKYSVSRRSIPDGLPFARLWERGMSMQASDVMEGGYLAGKISTQREVGRDPGGIRQRIIDDVPGFVSLAGQLGGTPAQLAIAFTLTHPATSTTLFGASSVAQLETNLGSLELLNRVGAAEIRARVEPFWADRDVVDPEGP